MSSRAVAIAASKSAAAADSSTSMSAKRTTKTYTYKTDSSGNVSTEVHTHVDSSSDQVTKNTFLLHFTRGLKWDETESWKIWVKLVWLTQQQENCLRQPLAAKQIESRGLHSPEVSILVSRLDCRGFETQLQHFFRIDFRYCCINWQHISSLTVQWIVKSQIKLIEPIQYWLVAS